MMPLSIVQCEQGTPEWFKARLGRLTGSCAGIIYAKPRKGAEESVQRRDLRIALALERVIGRPLDDVEYLGRDVERGKELEAEAVAAYEARTGALVSGVGFIGRTDLLVGVSPDGLVGDGGGIEVKCPKPAIQLARIETPGIPSEYVPQVCHALLVTGRAWWDFVSYCPALPEPHDVLITRLVAADMPDVLRAHHTAVKIFLAEVEKEEAAVRKLTAEAVPA